MNLYLYKTRVLSKIVVLLFLNSVFCAAQHAVEFQESNSSLKITDHPDLQLQQFSIECWIMPQPGGIAISTGVNDADVYPIISRGIHDPAEETGINYLLGLRQNDNALYFEFESSPSEEIPFKSYSLSGFTSLKQNAWYHVVASFNGNEIKLYLNGKLESMVEAFHQPYASAAGDLGIACAFTKSSQQLGSFSGRIDALRIFNYARSQMEILGSLNSETMTGLSGLVLGIDYNEGTGTLINTEGSIPSGNLSGFNFNWSSGAHFQTLIPTLNKPTPLLSIGIISDPQYCDCDPPVWAERIFRETLNKLPVAIDTLNNRGVDFSVTLGDIIDTLYVSFGSILPLYDDFSADHFFVLGNHDFAMADSNKSKVVDRLDMPGYYYTIDKDAWKFIVLDGTELASYTRVLHPELGDEADSIINSISGEIHDEYWNGGISRTQQAWLREQIQLADANQQNVVLFSHFPVLPDSSHLNLWNKDTLINLIKDYDNVVAYINGHNHYGNYALKNSVHYITNYSMVETYDTNSYSILDIYPSSFNISGFGYNPDRIISYDDKYRGLEIPQLENVILHYYHDSSAFISIPFISGQNNEQINYSLIGDTVNSDNEMFLITNDSLFLAASPDYLNKNEFTIKLGAIDYLFDSVSASISLQLDTTVAIKKTFLNDTLLAIGEKYPISLDTLYIDYSKNGLTISCQISNPEVLSYSQEDRSIQFHPLKYGSTEVDVIVFDAYTGSYFSDTLTISVYDPENIPPVHENYDLVVSNQDTISFLLDTLFYDANDDQLSFEILPSNSEFMHYVFGEGKILKVWADKGLVNLITIIANDMRGGMDTTTVMLKFNTSPIKIGVFNDLTIHNDDPSIVILLDTIYSDPDQDTLNYILNFSNDLVSGEINVDWLSITPVELGTTTLNINISDNYGGLLEDIIQIAVTEETTQISDLKSINQWSIYPNPVYNTFHLESRDATADLYHFRLVNHLGQENFSIGNKYIESGSFSLSISIQDLPDGIYYLYIESEKESPSVLKFVKISKQ